MAWEMTARVLVAASSTIAAEEMRSSVSMGVLITMAADNRGGRRWVARCGWAAADNGTGGAGGGQGSGL